MTEAVNFLRDRELRPLALPEAHGLRAIGLALGKGPNALEVVIAESAIPHNLTNLRNAWRARLGGRATPLLLVVLFDGKVALCGPGGEHPPAFVGLDSDPIERICATALDEPDRHAALRFLRSVIPQLEPGVRVAGLRNEGLLATHELQSDVPQRGDWPVAVEKAKGALRLRSEGLVKALGFSLEALPGSAYILRAAAFLEFADVGGAVALHAYVFPGVGPQLPIGSQVARPTECDSWPFTAKCQPHPMC